MTAGNQPAKSAAKKRGLGRGLEALLGPKAAAEAPPLQAMPGDALRTLPVDAMVPGKYQPRRSMDEAKLEELASSIRSQGVIQPIVVREHVGADGKGGRTYEIIAGERRWRASQRAGLTEVPVVVRVVDDRTVVAMALIENIQREDLNPLEEAQALQRLIDEFDLTHAAAAEAVAVRAPRSATCCACWNCRPRSARWCRPARSKWAMHARCCRWPRRWRSRWRSRPPSIGWSVREVEHRVQQLSSGKVSRHAEEGRTEGQAAGRHRRAGTRAVGNPGQPRGRAHGRGGKGKLVIHYADSMPSTACSSACATSPEGTRRMSANDRNSRSWCPCTTKRTTSRRWSARSSPRCAGGSTSRSSTSTTPRATRRCSACASLQASTPELRVLHHLSRAARARRCATASRPRARRGSPRWMATARTIRPTFPSCWRARCRGSATSSCSPAGASTARTPAASAGRRKWANAIRSRMLRDDTPDTGCGIKLFEREAFLDLPYFDHMHRYLPALMQRAGWQTVSVPVNHRDRTAGVSKYNNLNRAWSACATCAAWPG